MDGLERYMPHPGQQSLHISDSRFRIVCCGRRWGKTLGLAAELLNRAHRRAGDYGWIAPTYNTAERGLDAIRQIAGDLVTITGRAPTLCRIPTRDGGEARLFILSADNPDSMRGYGFRGIVVDEAASIDADVWQYVLRPTIAQTQGWAVMISTPAGRNWFFDLYTRGLDPQETEFQAFRFPSNSNPYFPPAEWEEAKRTTPADIFRQEYEADFLEDSAGVFRNLEACLLRKAAERTGDVSIGCDLAKHTDWTVLVAMDRKTGACLDFERFNQLDWPIQKERITAFCRKWNGLVHIDATGIGDPIYDDLRRVVPRIEGVKLTNQRKTELIQRLIVATEQRHVTWPKEWEILTTEMQRYEYEITASGLITYNAPSGYHDDCVMALALAAAGRYPPGRSGPVAIPMTTASPMRRQMARKLSA